ncbi:MAG: NUDIX hydrolase family protein [Actinobacteria bacterium]|nr:NUDIX hydrolase family protein [Actinomycetota bacterium]
MAETAPGWLAETDLGFIRDRVPLVYVEAVPVRVDHLGRVQKVGLLLRAMPDGSISRALVSGRVLHGETLREALWRHLTKDLGPEAEPQLPAAPAPFTVAEYFPDPRRTGFSDPRQHAVSLAYIVPCTGTCAPAQDALDFSWLSPEEAVSPGVAGEMGSGHDRLVRMALGHVGQLP